MCIISLDLHNQWSLNQSTCITGGSPKTFQEEHWAQMVLRESIFSSQLSLPSSNNWSANWSPFGGGVRRVPFPPVFLLQASHPSGTLYLSFIIDHQVDFSTELRRVQRTTWTCSYKMLSISINLFNQQGYSTPKSTNTKIRMQLNLNSSPFQK